MKMTAKKVFHLIIQILVVLAVILVGSAIKITNPWIWIANIIVLAIAFVGGYLLGTKSEKK